MQHDASARDGASGRLIFLVGPSGSGKDSLINASRAHLSAAGVEIARRVITRSAEAKGEEAHGVSAERFAQLREAGAFAMHWQANGLEYGIPAQVDQWLAQGRSVLVNGSRAYLPAARERYPNLLAVCLDVQPEVLRERLLARGRETPEQVDQRLARNARLQLEAAPSVHTLDNSGDLAAAVTALFELLRQEKLIA
ncbi:TPA: phosphonate metabolism protein/1,5-bisphosphokinase (PRPP-forming) PhnN [Pseudomonas putida]|uniref:phosphonate metabolism protein/1,5-bisphosphokinase (PRPP-forming) PhnN n=1 Tax=Pseudomonas TaxID=286 RepID=UPI000760C966|nr:MULTISPECIES: phosphonate metabolism protein/1,5-bisphosphokinase (PRPP-forming) PhnN [Pseudomonas]MDD2151293.1 phosphonate metabolism protein/1,5-bisphosphokinase (PRPP-forming) PhnN [Pseudomonas putida]HDS1680697.1 phosphonate metabolism protein/1,5-bisphosphokinase (PRPP-forming) PhnN [Pseudomonas putida]